MQITSKFMLFCALLAKCMIFSTPPDSVENYIEQVLAKVVYVNKACEKVSDLPGFSKYHSYIGFDQYKFGIITVYANNNFTDFQIYITGMNVTLGKPELQNFSKKIFFKLASVVDGVDYAQFYNIDFSGEL